jgi:uncharacterized protein YoxC
MDKLLEFGQVAGTPIAYLVIILFAYKLFELVTSFITTMNTAVGKFVDKHFTHIDNMEKELQESNRINQENNKINTDNTKQFTQAINALTQVVSLQTQTTNNITHEIKPLTQSITKVEQTIRHCEQMATRRGDN